MNQRSVSLSLIVSAGLLVSGATHAQLNLQQFGIGGGNSSNSAAATSSGGVTQLLQSYVGANQQVLSGQSSLASAMGLGSAADKAGIHPNDIVVAFGAHSVTSIDVLHKLLSEEHADVKTPVTILRGVEKLVIEMTPEYPN